MKYKVVIVGPTGTVYKDTNAFRLLYPLASLQLARIVAQSARYPA